MSAAAGPAAIVSSRAARLYIALAGLFVTNALIAEFVGIKIFAPEDTIGVSQLVDSFIVLYIAFVLGPQRMSMAVLLIPLLYLARCLIRACLRAPAAGFA